MTRSLALVTCLALVACGAPATVTPAPAAPLPKPGPRAPRATFSMVPRRRSFLPDGRMLVSYRSQTLVTRPETPTEGELVPFAGAIEAVGHHILGIAVDPAELPRERAWRLVSLDPRLHEIRSLALEGFPLVDVSADGELFSVAGRKAGIYRTGDFSLVAGDLPGGVNGRPFGRLPTAQGGRYVVLGANVVDTVAKKVVFSAVSLGKSPWIIEGGKLHWLYRDLLETVDLATGKTRSTWLPCHGPAEVEPGAARMYVACEDVVVRVTMGASEVRVETIALPPKRFASSLTVDPDGRVVVATARTGDVRTAIPGPTPVFFLEKGASTLTRESPPRSPPRTVLEPDRENGGSCVVRFRNDTKPARSVPCDATLSPDGRYFAWGAELVSLEADAPAVPPSASGVRALRIEDGAIVATNGATGADAVRFHEVRIAPKAPPGETARIEAREGAHDVVTVFDASGAKLSAFAFEPFWNGTARVVEAGVVVSGSDFGEDGAFPHVLCSRDGTCEPLLPKSHVMGAGPKLVYGRRHPGDVLEYTVLGTKEIVSVALPARVESAIEVADGIYAVVGSGAERALVHVSLATRTIDTTTKLTGIEGRIVATLGDALVFVAGASLTLVDARSKEVVGEMAFGPKGYVTIDASGRYRLSGDAAGVEERVMCTDGRVAFPRTRCAAPR